ncbi:unnamed protein product [Parajaminaea phylloscopi]
MQGSRSQAVPAHQVEEAALHLAVSAREFLGLPVERHDPEDAQQSRPAAAALPYTPPTLPSPPTPIEFARRLTTAAPFVIRSDALADRPAIQAWKTPGYLVRKMGDRHVRVSVTPDGRADDIKTLTGGKTVFALPAEQDMTMAELLGHVNAASSSSSSSSNDPVYYLQSQNSNLTDKDAGAGDLSPLLHDVLDPQGRSDIPWASEAIGSQPEALNIWIGSSKSRSSMHRDHYENVFYCLRGNKIFTVFPPTEAHYLCERDPFEVYRHSSDAPYDLISDPEGTPPTPWIPIDPTQSPYSARNKPYTRYAKGLKPLEIRVREGEVLFLPAGWYHHVGQVSDDRPEDSLKGPGGACIALNWWYESEGAFGPSWALLEFVKTMGDAVY